MYIYVYFASYKQDYEVQSGKNITSSYLTSLLKPPILNIMTQLHNQRLTSINQTKQVQATPRVTQSDRGSRKYDSCDADALTMQLYLSFDCHLYWMHYFIIVRLNIFSNHEGKLLRRSLKRCLTDIFMVIIIDLHVSTNYLRHSAVSEVRL